LGTTRIRHRRDDGLPVYTYGTVPGMPPVSALRFSRQPAGGGLPLDAHPHAHDFLVLTTLSETAARCGWETESGE
jgi:hypothetical protein